MSSPATEKVAPAPTTKAAPPYTNLDVLCGRGQSIRAHPGNIRYLECVLRHADDYKRLPKGEKLQVVQKVVAEIRKTGRFLQKVGEEWEDIRDEKAMQKTSQAFRDLKDPAIKTSKKRKSEAKVNTQSPPNLLRRKKRVVADGLKGKKRVIGMKPKTTLFFKDGAFASPFAPESAFSPAMGRKKNAADIDADETVPATSKSATPPSKSTNATTTEQARSKGKENTCEASDTETECSHDQRKS